MQLHKVGYSLLVLLFLGAVGCNKSTSSDLAAITAGGNSPTPTPTPAPQTNFKLYVGVQGNDGHSYVQTLTYDSAAHTYAVAVNSKFQVDDGAAISADSLRVTTDMLDGNILLGGGSNTLRVFNTSNNTVSNSITLTGLSDVAGARVGYLMATFWRRNTGPDLHRH